MTAPGSHFTCPRHPVGFLSLTGLLETSTQSRAEKQLTHKGLCVTGECCCLNNNPLFRALAPCPPVVPLTGVLPQPGRAPGPPCVFSATSGGGSCPMRGVVWRAQDSLQLLFVCFSLGGPVSRDLCDPQRALKFLFCSLPPSSPAPILTVPGILRMRDK